MSYNSASKSIEIMKSMFPDSSIAGQVTFGSTKAAYLVVFGLAPYFQDVLEKYLKGCSYYTLCFDESLNKISQRSQMDIAVRYWDNEVDEVQCSYFTSTFIEGRATAENLKNHFKDAIKSVLKDERILQISMDGPNVNWKFLDLFTEDGDCNLLDLGSCGLHVIHGALQTGHKASDWNVDATLRGL